MAVLQHITSPSTSGASAEAYAPTFSDIEVDVGHLCHLLQVTLGRLEDLPFTREDGSRNFELDEINALLWIARNMAGKLQSDLEVAQCREAEATGNA